MSAVELPGIIHLGESGWWVGAFDARGRHKSTTFTAEAESWPQLVAWLREVTDTPTLAVAGDRGDGLVGWLSRQGFDVTVVPAPASRVTIASLRATARVMTSAGGAREWFSVELDDMGRAELTRRLGAYPVVQELTVYDAFGTSGLMVEGLVAAGLSPALKKVSGRWHVYVDSDPDSRAVSAHLRHVTDELVVPATTAGNEAVRRWIAELGPVAAIEVRDAGQGSVSLAAALRQDGYEVTEKRRPTRPLVAPPGVVHDGIGVQLVLRGLGCLDFHLTIEDDARVIDAGWMTPAWRDTLTGLAQAVRGEPAVVVWSYEPGCYQLAVVPDGSGVADVQLRILRESVFGRPDRPDAGDLEGQWTLRVRALAQAFSSATHQVIDHLDAEDVTALWPAGIPYDQLAELDALLSDP